jgi:hypothetical protein
VRLRERSRVLPKSNTPLLLGPSWLPGIFRVQQLHALDSIGSGNRLRINKSEYSGTRNIGKYSANGILSVSCAHPSFVRLIVSLRFWDAGVLQSFVNGTVIVDFDIGIGNVTNDSGHVLNIKRLISCHRFLFVFE